ncbi:flagellar biosynthesis protein FlhB [Aliifodinibius sp. S!AR15-10]|uniref:flagellar biosynthesis protein FlhB n=1 Tax=Aliifodinibius sp. S!AR15-10 TaxID=2950437 RepID=UPI002863CD03|nr:flagellar biosynthesis protein FlhB [Aliifodinibius sp. S!AR15-10]MDR8394235.1 flagellar biosynthesis protein FlhB [Aliifodinibius sp. S!AR15-10]
MFSARLDDLSLLNLETGSEYTEGNSAELVLYLIPIYVMSDQNSAQEKTEEPTQRRLEKAREEGNISISTEISSVMLMLVSVITIIMAGGHIYGLVEGLFENFFLNAGKPLENQEHAIKYIGAAATFGLRMMVPLLIILTVTAIGVNLIQTKGAFSLKAIQPKASKINPLNGLKRIFSMQGFVELAKGFLKLLIIGLIVYFTVFNNLDYFISFAVLPLETSVSESGSYVLIFIGRILAALFILAIADTVYQQFQHKKDLRMTKKEVKDERKETEGDPHVKSKRKEMGMAFRQKRLDHAVLESDVVVTNPTHYAVALQYDPEENNAPIVMVKGQRLRAQKIKKLAREFEIPIVENKPVAQALFASAEEDEYIPEDLYRAVAEILAYVYKLENKHNQ